MAESTTPAVMQNVWPFYSAPISAGFWPQLLASIAFIDCCSRSSGCHVHIGSQSIRQSICMMDLLQ